MILWYYISSLENEISIKIRAIFLHVFLRERERQEENRWSGWFVEILEFSGNDRGLGETWTPLACTMERNRTQRHAERMHGGDRAEGPSIIWLAPLEACVFIRRRLGAAQFQWITSGNQPSWPELSAKCNPRPNPPPETWRISLSLSRFLSSCTYFKLPASIALHPTFCYLPPPRIGVLHTAAMNARRETFEFKVRGGPRCRNPEWWLSTNVSIRTVLHFLFFQKRARAFSTVTRFGCFESRLD